MKRTEKGITFLELVVAMVILGLAVPVILNLFAAVGRPYVQAETLARSTLLAADLLEEVLSQRFDELLERTPGDDNWTLMVNLGPDYSSEVAGTPSTFDDVDDFHGFSDNPAGGFTRSVSVKYVDGELPNIGTPTALITDPLASRLDWPDRFIGSAYADDAASGTTDYKQITVTVAGPEGVGITLVGLATLVNSREAPAQ